MELREGKGHSSLIYSHIFPIFSSPLVVMMTSKMQIIIHKNVHVYKTDVQGHKRCLNIEVILDSSYEHTFCNRSNNSETDRHTAFPFSAQINLKF